MDIVEWVVENNGVVIGVLGFVAYNTWTVATKFTSLTDRLGSVEREIKLLDDRWTKWGLNKAKEYDRIINEFDKKHELLAMEIRTKLASIEAILQELKSR